MLVGISGGTGLIGVRLVHALLKRGDSVRVFSRQKRVPEVLRFPGVEFVSSPIPKPFDWEGLDAFVNLAGESLAGVRWTEESKKKFWTSRVDHTSSIVNSFLSTNEQRDKLKVFIQASAVGYYGSGHSTSSILDEGSPPCGDGYLSLLAKAWEEAILPLKSSVRVAIVRIGIVLDPRGGALGKLIPVFKAFLGGPIASGEQGMSWIHYKDLVGIFLHILDRPELAGVFNGTSPNPVTNRVFSRTLAEVLNRPSFVWTPAFPLQVAFGEGAKVLTEGQFVYPRRTIESGYLFLFPELRPALQNLINEF